MEKNDNRDYILSVLKNKKVINITNLSRIIDISRPVLYQHLSILEKEGMIKLTKSIHTKGSPVLVELNSEKYNKEINKKVLPILRKLKEYGDSVDMITFLKQEKVDYTLLLDSKLLNYVSEKIFLTDQGKQLLEENPILEDNKDSS